MTQIQPQTTRRFLAVAISAVISGQALALEAISDEDMSAATGEGIAFLPEDFSVRLNGADNTNGGAGTEDTGYIRIIPVGPLTFAAQDTNRDGVLNASDNPVGKGDIFLYGAAISQSAQAHSATRTSADWNSRFGRPIDSWGTAANPWLLKVETENNVPDFAAPTPTATSSGSVSYLALEAPLRHVNIAPLSPEERSAYNLKAAFWADAFVRNPSVVENLTATGTQFDVGGAGRANRLRLQAIWDGFSINGSQLRIFQTLGGAQTGVQGMSSSYNNTLGIAGLLRFNSGQSSTLRASFTQTSAATRASTTTNRYTTTFLGQPGATNVVDRQYRLRSVDTTDTFTGGSWTAPTLSSVLRFSTRETSNTGLLSTPAINGGGAPTFEANEGLFIYNLNMNLVLGSLYQPLTVGVAPDGNNIVLELARIPNKESIYKRIYTNYANSNPATNGGYLGSTCNVHQCGTTRTLGDVSYQGNSATHSSISIGSTEYNPVTNTLTAHRGNGALGISFGSLRNNTGATPVVNRYYQLQQQFREPASNTQWRYQNANGTFTNGTNNCAVNTGCYQFGQFGQWRPVDSFNQPAIAPLYNPTTAQAAQNVTGQTNAANNFAVPARGPLAGVEYSGTTWTSNPPPATVPGPMMITGDNNLGSAVIDGLLIQHLKFTTRGL